MDIVYEACKILKMVLQARAPYDTGNLSLNAIRIVGDRVIIGGEIADYAIYTNEPWTAEKRNGAKNPNEGWVQNAIREAAPLIQKVLNGKARNQDVINTKAKYKQIIAERKAERIRKIKGEEE